MHALNVCMCVCRAYTFRCQHDTHFKLLHPCARGGFDATLPNDDIFATVDGFFYTPALFIHIIRLQMDMFVL